MTRKKKRPIRHHFISEVYLRRFADSHRHIRRVSRATGEARDISVKDAAVETDFYTITGTDGVRSGQVEDFLSYFETHAGIALSAIDRGIFPPTDDHRAQFAVFVALMQTRTPEMRHLLEEDVDFTIKAFFQAMPREEIRRHLREQYEREPTEDEIDRIAAGLKRSDLFRVKTPKNATVATALLFAFEHLGRIVFEMKWQLVTTERSAFLTSDHPVVFWREGSSDMHPPGIGLLTADETYFPLGPCHLLVLTKSAANRPAFQATPETIMRVNAELVNASYEWIFHHPEHDVLHDIAIPDERPLLTVNGAPVYRGGRGSDEALSRVRRSVLHQPDRSSSFAITVPGYVRAEMQEGWHGNPAVRDKWQYHYQTFNSSPLRKPTDKLIIPIGIGSNRAVYVFMRDGKYWAIAHNREADTWEDLGEQSEETVRRLRD